ncbi:Uncharacterized protein dnm_042850 [Desulfonema magnum]|uniref:Uncharacterized protein n=1 Tax=Desulfonema magnum TaxID=45655 RepID=A0A975GPT8_9BACT|nr:Uncharacterized protein dnm_042850 [Desulfonema magnum]
MKYKSEIRMLSLLTSVRLPPDGRNNSLVRRYFGRREK